MFITKRQINSYNKGDEEMAEGALVIRDQNNEVISKLSFTQGESLLLLCKKAGFSLPASCNGKGTCGRCKVQFVKGAPLPQATERQKLTAEELRQGYRLACLTKPNQDCEIILPSEAKPDAVTGKIETGWQLDVPGFFLAADIGTTTIVIEKRRKCDGSIVDTYKAVNNQRSYGADVLSRMEAAMEGKAEELATLIRAQLVEGIQYLNRDKTADFMVVAANTTMIHLLMEYPVEGLAKAPFKPYTLKEVITEIAGIKTILMPGISAFVGADIMAGLLAVHHMTKQSGKAMDKNGEYQLFVDLGTNAELVLYDKSGGICTATAAGPAFEGDAGTGFFGSDMVAVLAWLFEKGMIDENGTLSDEYFEHGVLIPCDERKIHISQQQIRNLQLAKAAVRTGIEVLMQKAGITEEQIKNVYLAGGFGYYLDVHASVTIGLLPPSLERKTIACGNTALVGAAVYAHQLMTGAEKAIQIKITSINLAEEELFKENYVNQIDMK